MSHDVLQTLLDLMGPESTGGERKAATGPGEYVTVLLNEQTGRLVCSQSREMMQLDEDARAAMLETLLRLTANSRFHERPSIGALRPDGAISVSREFDSASLSTPLLLELDRMRWTLNDLLRMAIAERGMGIPQPTQEVAWTRA
ncbi:hypothetical protein D1006_35150 [Burkholderia stabilis]|uniref:Uncharacterized protein n=1 Tax=Burkholderia stabilis TaxID=95485 RepID=A0A4Q2A7E3_9BURK|nr:hypothetical protein [Burkholderia stabilis]RXV65336.1 hypothetical protein D1006_35150 [Burkholderia stabilis]